MTMNHEHLNEQFRKAQIYYVGILTKPLSFVNVIVISLDFGALNSDPEFELFHHIRVSQK